jgi:hypothetical protein
MIDICDSCGDEKDVREMVGDGGVHFWWCKECEEEDDRIASLPVCERCDRPTEEDHMSGPICIGCETQSEVNYWRTR